jgi:hypothetical protein
MIRHPGLQLREAAERLITARQAQGLPDRITDAATLARIAALLIAAPVVNDKAGCNGTSPNLAAGLGPGTNGSKEVRSSDAPSS